MTPDEIITKYGYTSVDNFSQGLARTQKDGMWFHIHPDGTAAYEQRYDAVGNFTNSGTGYLAAVLKDGLWCHIHPDGTVAYQERFEWVGTFHCVGTQYQAMAYNNGKSFYIRPNGTRIK